MALRYLLDTNIVSDLVRHPQGSVAKRIQEHGEHAICTSIIVAAELRYGGVKSASKELVDSIDLLLSAIEVLPLEDPADRHYAELRHDLNRRGEPIGPNDMLIAAQALAADLAVVTANLREFSRVPRLAVENWLA
jgi:tRNA(fMet)-specific endonuclease VapC